MQQMKNYDEITFVLDDGVRFFPGKRCVISESGEIIGLSENSYRFLLLLITGETDKQEIINQVWYEQRGSVTDSSYYGQIYILRKALDLAGLSSSLIRTIPRKGVKYIGKVTRQETSDSDMKITDGFSPLNVIDDVSSEVIANDSMAIQEDITKSPNNKNHIEWYNSPQWNKLITILAVLAVCWLSTILLTIYYFLFH